MARQNKQIKLLILKALQEIGEAAGAARIHDRLAASGTMLQPRTVRYYLLQLDREGLTRFVGRRKGREVSERGREELARANIIEKVGFVEARIDSLGYRMTFSLGSEQGTIIANIATIRESYLARALEDMKPVFARRLGMGSRIAVAREEESIGGFTVPRGMVGIATVCSVTVNGILLDEGIPVTSRFGGLLEMREGKPVRFVELIEYRGTTLDPLETFIQAGMTRVRDCARTGSGVIGASFREIPSVALADVNRVQKRMEAGSPPCSPQMPSLRVPRVLRPRSAAIATSSPTPSTSRVTKGSCSRMPWRS
ncbi:MAG: Ribonuclease R winged-helix domain protein [Verrucomicrobia bacterium ADurb.Bin345]|nr:MAG: Ribonuclease R winged-helix domain protein [Verrucomicrobia bacterium ADurb.Bin345]